MPDGEGMSAQCREHSGLTVWIKVGCALLGLLCSLFTISSFYQLPTMKEEIVSKITVQDARITKLETKMEVMEAKANAQ